MQSEVPGRGPISVRDQLEATDDQHREGDRQREEARSRLIGGLELFLRGENARDASGRMDSATDRKLKYDAHEINMKRPN